MPKSQSSAAEFRDTLLALAERFNLLSNTEPPNVSSDELWSAPPPGHQMLIREKAERDRRAEYDQGLSDAGAILVELHNRRLVADERLLALVAAHECGGWGPVVRTTANLFVLYAGGPRIELADPQGDVAEYEAVGDGVPPSIRPILANTPREATANAFGLPRPVDPERCRLYARTCRASAQAIDIPTPPGSIAKGKAKRVRGEAAQQALIVLSNHSDWSVKQIAEKAGCDHTTLYRNKTFMKAFNALHMGDPPPAGHKQKSKGRDDLGGVEAYG